MPNTEKELGTMLRVSTRILSASALKIFWRQFGLMLPGTGSWALHHRADSVKEMIQNILPNQLNSSVFV